jgi:hypothetical protein
MRSLLLFSLVLITACGKPHNTKPELQPKKVEPQSASPAEPLPPEPVAPVATVPPAAPASAATVVTPEPAPVVTPDPAAPAPATSAKGVGAHPRVREQLGRYQTKSHEGVDINNAGFLGHAGISYVINKPECSHLLNGDIVSYQFKGNYVQKWSTYASQISIKSVTEITGIIEIQLDSNWHEDVELHFANDGKSSTKSTAEGRGFSPCFTKLGECNSTVAALESEIRQIELRPATSLDDRQKNTLTCAKGLATTFKNATSELKKVQ